MAHIYKCTRLTCDAAVIGTNEKCWATNSTAFKTSGYDMNDHQCGSTALICTEGAQVYIFYIRYVPFDVQYYIFEYDIYSHKSYTIIYVNRAHFADHVRMDTSTKLTPRHVALVLIRVLPHAIW